MDPLQRMEKALAAASDAGDVNAARHIAAEMRKMLKDANPDADAPIDHAAVGAKNLAKETSTGEAMLVGSGRTGEKLISGLKQGYLALPSYPLLTHESDAAKTKLSGEQRQADTAFSALRRAHPLASIVGEAAPYAAVPASIGPIKSGLTVGALEGLQYGSSKERASKALIGGTSTMVAGALANAGGQLISPVTTKAAGKSHQAALDAAERIGYQPLLSEVTGSKFIRSLEDYASRAPGGSGVMDSFRSMNAASLNRAAAKSIGETADELSPDVFARAAQRIGKVFEDVKSLPGRPIRLSQNVGSAADDILRQQAKMLPTQQDEQLINIAQQAKALAANKGRIDGESYQLIRSGLSDAAFDATGTNKVLYGRLLESIDDSAEASLKAGGNSALADALRVARPQYKNLKLLEKGAIAEGGDVGAAKLASALRSQNPSAFRRGAVKDEIGDIATIGEALKPLREGSQTFGREAVSNPLTAALHAIMSYPVARATTSPIVSLYPRTVGKTTVARRAAELANPASRSALVAALESSALLPVATE